jgi:hypothetical protein
MAIPSILLDRPKVSSFKACLPPLTAFGHEPGAMCQHQHIYEDVLVLTHGSGFIDVRLTWAAPEPCNAIMSTSLPYRHPQWRFCQPPAALEAAGSILLPLSPDTLSDPRARAIACITKGNFF